VTKQRTLEGEVVSDKMQKTIVVRVERVFQHPLLGKVIRRFKKFKAHDESNNAKVGDWVEIIESKPLSKTKHMVLQRVIRKAS
jgi:small subunit ribosomal protein S17